MKRKTRLLAAGALTATVVGAALTGPAYAIAGGDVKIETNQSIYNKGDDVALEIKIKASDGSNFLLQTDISWSNGMTLKSVSGDNIQYNRGKIVGTAPMSEFIINVTLSVNAESDQTIKLSNVKMGAVDGSQNYTIDKSEKTLDVKEPAAEPTPPETTPPTTPTPPIEEPKAPEQPEKPAEPETPYKSWKATVTVSDNLNVREGPGLDYNIIGKYNDGDHVTVTNEQKGGDITWLKVEKGWISKDYVVEGHLEKPEKTDEEIEREQQEQIRNEAENTENENQANNEAAQQKDENKKQEYDKQEQEQQATEPVTKDTEEDTAPEEITEKTEIPAADDYVASIDRAPGKNPITTIEDSSYVQYWTETMTKPFYLYLEAYSLHYPEGFKNVSQSIGGLDFLFAVPNELGAIKNNVFLIFGNYDSTKEPALYYFDRDSDSFFPYDRMFERTVVIDNTIEYEKKEFSKSHLVAGILGLLGIYAIGAFTTALSIRKKEQKKNQTPLPAITHSVPAKAPKIYKPDPDAVKDMTDEELDELLKIYGASTSDMVKRASKMNQETQRLDSLKNVPPVKKASIADNKAAKAQNVAPTQTTESKISDAAVLINEKPAVGENQAQKMSWNTLTKIMENPENIEEAPMPAVIPNNEESEKKAAEIIEAVETKLEIAQEEPEQAPTEEITAKLDAALSQPEETPANEEPVIVNLEFEPAFHPNDTFDMDEVSEMQAEFEKAVAEDNLNSKDATTNSDSEDEG